MAEKLLGARLRDPRRRLGPRLPPPRERDRADRGGAGRAAGADLDAQRDGPHRRRGKMSKSVGNIFQLSEALDRFGAEAVVAYLISGHYRQPLEFSEDGARGGRGRGSSGIRNFFREASAERRASRPVRGRAPRGVPRRRSPTTSTPRARWAALFELIAEGNRRPLAGAREALAELLPLLGLESLAAAARTARRRGGRRCSPSASGPAPTRDFARADEIRDRLARPRLGGPRHARRARSSCAGPERAASRDRLRAPAGRRGQARPPPGAPGLDRRRHRRRRARPGSPARPTTRGSSPRSIPTRTPTRRRCWRAPRRWSSPSTRSRTRTTSAPSPARPRPRAPTGW